MKKMHIHVLVHSIVNAIITLSLSTVQTIGGGKCEQI